jgi:3-hydroxyisobutyrate dehydrogenase-like beta-hydroxyacid dehydrogenase
MVSKLALIGFGEAASCFALAGKWARAASVWDVRSERRQLAADTGLVASDSGAQALAGAGLVLSLVTADQAVAAVKESAPNLQPGAIWCDMNSVAPETKREAAKAIEAFNGRYVDVAVLSPVHPADLAVPLLLSGDCAADAERMLHDIGFSNLQCVGAEIGRASSIKMIRSIMIKGIEALNAEMMAGAWAAGVFDEVIASLDASEQTMTWQTRSAYNLERMATHGLRRAAEMEEVAKTLIALGVEPVMTKGTIRRQREMGLQTEGSA